MGFVFCESSDWVVGGGLWRAGGGVEVYSKGLKKKGAFLFFFGGGVTSLARRQPQHAYNRGLLAKREETLRQSGCFFLYL